MRGNKEQQDTSDNVRRRNKNWEKPILHRTLCRAVISILFDKVMQNVAGTFNAKTSLLVILQSRIFNQNWEK